LGKFDDLPIYSAFEASPLFPPYSQLPPARDADGAARTLAKLVKLIAPKRIWAQ